MNERTAWLRTRFAGILKNHGFAVVEDAPVIFDLTEAQGVLCRCAANKCGPHRCWPSCVMVRHGVSVYCVLFDRHVSR